MEDNDYVLTFDHFYTTNHIQILKSLMPFMDSEISKMLPAVIKYLELKYTLSLINSKSPGFTSGINACSSSSDSEQTAVPAENLENIYKAIHKYLAPDEEKSFQQILSAVRTMKNVREMQQMLELFQSLNPDMDSSAMMDGLNMGNVNGMDMSELMKLFGGNNNGSKQ